MNTFDLRIAQLTILPVLFLLDQLTPLWQTLVLAGVVFELFTPPARRLRCVAATTAPVEPDAGAGTHTWRQRWISRPVLRLFRRILPPMSPTEKEALDAGTVGWDGELFSGCPDWEKLQTQPTSVLSAEETAFLSGPVETLCGLLDDWAITHKYADLPPEVWQYLKDNGFFAMIIPHEYGGLDFCARAHSDIVMKIATRSVTAAVTVMVPNSLGPAKLLLEYGTDEQKQYYLPRLATGAEIPCFALTGPEAGSDASAMPDNGVLCHAPFEGRDDVLGIRLNWEKRYITLGPVATLLGLAFKLYDPDHLLGEKTELGITLALIPTDTAGVEIGRRHLPLNIPFMNGPNAGHDVFIPLEWIIGGEARIGQGWRMLMECLADGRAISLPALSTGAGKLCSRATGAYARIRRQFHVPIGYFEGVEEALARIGAYTYMMDAARTLTTDALDRGEKPAVISAIVKYHLTEMMRRAVNDAMDIHGGKGITLGPRNLLGRSYQALPISITVEGANILTRSMIIFGQGAMRSHPYILRELEAARDDDPQHALQVFDRTLFQHAGFILRNLLRSLGHGLTGARFARVPGRGRVKRYYQHLTRLSACFALLTDAALVLLGGSLKRREKLSGRLADILSQLYLASACLHRYVSQGEQKDDQALLHWTCDDALNRTQMAMDGLLQNLPNRPVAWLLRAIVFPLGRRYSPPDDQTGQHVARLMLSPSPARDRLTAGMYLTDDLTQALGVLDTALQSRLGVEPIEKRLHQALRDRLGSHAPLETYIETGLAEHILSESEATQLRHADQLCQEVIRVDDLAPDLRPDPDPDAIVEKEPAHG